jgi:hypothetical protein
MKNLTNFTDFLNESEILNYKEIINYITKITPDESDVPDYFFDQIKKSGKKFELKRVKIEDILKKDESLREYVMSGEVRYGEDGESEHEPYPEDIHQPIVIFNGEVVDGYSRTAEHYRMGEDFIDAYVSI